MKTIKQRKEELEVEKLAAEVSELKSPWHRFTTGTGILAAVVALGAGAWGLYSAVSTFLDQRARQYAFDVSAELVDLSKQLASENRIERANAALLLSAFEEQALPILVTHLRHTEIDNLPTDIGYALRLVLAKENMKPDTVLGPLVEQTRMVLQEESKRATPSIAVVVNYVTTLGTVGAASEHAGSLEVLCEIRRAELGVEESLKHSVAEALRSISGEQSFECK